MDDGGVVCVAGEVVWYEAMFGFGWVVLFGFVRGEGYAFEVGVYCLCR